jgi:hypothetical protein
MRVRRFALAAVAAAAVTLLAGCDLLGRSTGAVVVGSLLPVYTQVPGATAYHVVFYDSATVMDAWADYDLAPQAASFSGVFPGDASVLLDTVNFQSADIPAGVYSVFAWIDFDGSGSFDPYQDLWGFYYGNPGGNTLIQPPANVLVPETGIVDLDIWAGYSAG